MTAVSSVVAMAGVIVVLAMAGAGVVLVTGVSSVLAVVGVGVRTGVGVMFVGHLRAFRSGLGAAVKI
ncbi:hypothetical protein [Aeromicrobium sp.]|uniref:hypothetical protein n=1 Tax=Aeromicrobium sp. TaxID=1871063 RepID=UPI0028A7BD1A|nr:hypothetical protein [Aeromicrobium sp.]